MKEKQKTLFSRRKILLQNRTFSEVKIESILSKAGIKYIPQKCFIAGDNYCIADIYIPRPYRTVIEIDGSCHDIQQQKRRDLSKDSYYRSRGFKVVHITNENVDSFDVKPFLSAYAS